MLNDCGNHRQPGKMLGGPRDGALLRYSLGSELLSQGTRLARQRFREAVERDANYPAAWKMLGKAACRIR